MFSQQISNPLFVLPRTLLFALVLGLIGSIGQASAQSVDCWLSDNGFEPGTPPLLPFGTTQVDRWDAEQAALIGAVGGVTPRTGTGMLEIQNTFLNASQVSQFVDVTDCQTTIDASRVGFRLSARLNGIPSTAVTGSVQLLAQDAPGINSGNVLGSYSIPFALDTNPATWEELSRCVTPLPTGTRFVGVQIAITNLGSLPIGAPLGYVDDVCVELFETKTDCLFSDPGFEPGSLPLIPHGSPVTDRWDVEEATLINGSVGPFAPLAGSGMLQISNTFLSTSQVTQYVDISACLDQVNASDVGFDFSAYLNGSSSINAGGSLVVLAQSAPGFNAPGALIASYSVPFSLDTDPTTWERVELCGLPLPPGTAFLGIQFGVTNSSSLSIGDPLTYLDEVCMRLTERKVGGPEFIRGDINRDGSVNIADVIDLLNFLFANGMISCPKAGDVNDDGSVDISDAIFLLGNLFPPPGGPPGIPAPVTCGADPTDDALTCPSYPQCP